MQKEFGVLISGFHPLERIDAVINIQFGLGTGRADADIAAGGRGVENSGRPLGQMQKSGRSGGSYTHIPAGGGSVKIGTG